MAAKAISLTCSAPAMASASSRRSRRSDRLTNTLWKSPLHAAGFFFVLPRLGLGRVLLLGLLHLVDGEGALEAGQVVDEERALQVVHLVLDADGVHALRPFLDLLSVVVEIAQADLQ